MGVYGIGKVLENGLAVLALVIVFINELQDSGCPEFRIYGHKVIGYVHKTHHTIIVLVIEFLQALDCGKATLALSAGVGVWVFVFLQRWQHLLHKESLHNPVTEICGNHLSHLGFRDYKGNG